MLWTSSSRSPTSVGLPLDLVDFLAPFSPCGSSCEAQPGCSLKTPCLTTETAKLPQLLVHGHWTTPSLGKALWRPSQRVAFWFCLAFCFRLARLSRIVQLRLYQLPSFFYTSSELPFLCQLSLLRVTFGLLVFRFDCFQRYSFPLAIPSVMVTFHYPFYKTQLEPAPNQKQMDLCMEEVSLAAGSSSTLSPIAHRPRGRAPGLTLPLLNQEDIVYYTNILTRV